MKAQLYLAAPLFSEAELEFNRSMKALLSPYFDIYLPQEDGRLLVKLLADGVPPSVAKKAIFSCDMAAIETARYFIIIMDGRAIDEGAAFELGVAFNLGKKCVGFQSDPRRLLPAGNNPMIDCALGEIFHTCSDLVEWAVREAGKNECGTDRFGLIPQGSD